MDDVTLDDMHRMLGERDIHAYRLARALTVAQKQVAALVERIRVLESPPDPPVE